MQLAFNSALQTGMSSATLLAYKTVNALSCHKSASYRSYVTQAVCSRFVPVHTM